jgi:acyl homoserine lactone synthase/acyl-homoserine lactone synthase
MEDCLVRAPLAPGDAALRAMFAARKEVFVDLLKWDLPVLAETYEIDQYDDPFARYLILVDAEGRHRASARLLRTDRPHLLGDHYAHLCTQPPPRGPSVREITRFCLDRRQSAAERRSARDQLVTALAEYALEHGITDYVGIAEPVWLGQIMAFGWTCSPLGPVGETSGNVAALRIRIDATTLPGLQETGVYTPASLTLISGAGEAA